MVTVMVMIMVVALAMEMLSTLKIMEFSSSFPHTHT